MPTSSAATTEMCAMVTVADACWCHTGSKEEMERLVVYSSDDVFQNAHSVGRDE